MSERVENEINQTPEQEKWSEKKRIKEKMSLTEQEWTFSTTRKPHYKEKGEKIKMK